MAEALSSFSFRSVYAIDHRRTGRGGGLGGLQPPQSCQKLPDSGKTLAKIFAMIRARIRASCGQK